MVWVWLKYRIIRPFFSALSKTKRYNLKIQGKENIPERGPFIVVSNHQSSADIIAVALALKPALDHTQMWPWAKMEIGQGKEGFLGKWLYSFFGVIPIDRENKNIEEAIKESHKCLKRGDIICIFPEGTRHKNKELGIFQFGVANLARTTVVPILPVGVYKREEDGGIQVNIGKVFYLGPRKRRYQALEVAEQSIEDIAQHIDNLKEMIAKHLPRDKRGINLLSRISRFLGEFIEAQDIDFKKICKLGEKEDIEQIRDEVLKLLPPDWKKIDKKRAS